MSEFADLMLGSDLNEFAGPVLNEAHRRLGYSPGDELPHDKLGEYVATVAALSAISAVSVYDDWKNGKL